MTQADDESSSCFANLENEILIHAKETSRLIYFIEAEGRIVDF